MVFHWQFNFADSRDITPNTPGDVLLVFTAADESEMVDSEFSDVALIWQDILPRSAAMIEPRTESPFRSFSAALVRENDYPEQVDSLWSVFHDNMSERDRNTSHSIAIECSDLSVFNASKIGGSYQPLQRFPGDPEPGTYVAQLSGIDWIELEHQFVHNNPKPSYPDLDSWREACRANGTLGIQETWDKGVQLGDCGQIGVYETNNGETVLSAESH